MGQSLAIPRVIPNDWKRLDLVINKIKMRLGRNSSPTFAGLTITGLAASSLVGTNASKALESVTIGTGLDYTRPTLSFSHLGIEALTDPGTDKILFWDDSASACKWLGMGNSIAITDVTLDTIQDIRTSASPTFAGLTVTNSCVLGSNSAVFQPATDSTTFFQVLDADGGVPILNVDTTNERVGIRTATPQKRLHLTGQSRFDGAMFFGVAGDYGTFTWMATAPTAFIFKAQAGHKLQLGSNNANDYLTIDTNGNVGIREIAPETLIEMTGTAPYLTLHNSTHEDIDGGRESRINFKGEQGVDPFEETTLARIEVGHDGSGADDKGYFDIFINDGDDGNSPTKSIRVDSLGTVLETGPIFLKETTTPTARDTYGAIYTTLANELFFQDGDGVEHLLHGDAFSNIWFHAPGSVEVTISTEDLFTKISSFTVVGHEDDIGNVVGSAATDTLTLSSGAGGEYEISFHGSITATGGADKEMVIALGIVLASPKDIIDVTDDTVTPIVITSNGHNLENGDMVEIVGVLGNAAANGSFIVDNKTSNTFEIVKLDATPTTGNGDYNEVSPTGDITILYPGNMEVHRMVRGADFGAISATGVHVLANSDVLSLYVANLSGITNLTISSVSLSAFRIGD